jgi:Fic/DOC family protein
MADEIKRVPWQTIVPLDLARAPKNGAFASLEALRGAWSEFLNGLGEQDRVAIRQRSLRRLAVETGIIERLYDVDWGLTLTLIAEGFAREVIERAEGRVEEKTLETLVAQRDSLEMVIDFVRANRQLSNSFIKELHAALTRTQLDQEVVDSLGRRDRRPLAHGEWKTQPNHVRLEDGTICECAPPEQVQSEMDQLLALYADLEPNSRLHPVVKATWLHHRFVQIHPFSDGNGRVARALTLLVLEKNQYAPLVVDRFHRAEYMAAIQQANSGDLSSLITLFTRLESAALTSELERPEVVVGGAAADVARTLAVQLSAVRKRKVSTRENALRARAIAIEARISHWFEKQEQTLSATFEQQGLSDVDVHYFAHDASKAHWFRGQIVRSARTSGHYADFSEHSKWWHLRIKLTQEGLQLSFVASIHGAGRDSGVMAVTTWAEIKPLEAEDARAEYFDTASDAFRFAYTETTDALEKRGAELEALLDAGLSVALARLLKGI